MTFITNLTFQGLGCAFDPNMLTKPPIGAAVELKKL